MNPSGNIANLTPFKRGHVHTSRRSGDVDKAIRFARRHSPEAIQTAIECMRDPTASWNDRLKALQVVLHVGLPKTETPSTEPSARTAAPTSLRSGSSARRSHQRYAEL